MFREKEWLCRGVVRRYHHNAHAHNLTDTFRYDMTMNTMSTPGIAILQLTVRHSTPAAEVALVALPTTAEAKNQGNSTGRFHESFVCHLAIDAPTYAKLSSCAK